MFPPALARLPVRRVLVSLAASAPWQAPAHPGDTLRRALVSGIYGAVPRAEQPRLLGGWFDLRHGSDRVRPYALDVSLPAELDIGDLVHLELTLVGHIPDPSVLVQGLQHMARKGLGDARVPHEVVRVHVLGRNAVDVDPHTGRGFPHPARLGEVVDLPPSPVDRLRVHFRAPYTDPEWRPPQRPEVLGLSAGMLFRAGVMRWRGLERAVGWEPSPGLAAPEAFVVESQLQWFEVDVQSRRKRRPDRLQGAMGSVTIEGRLGVLLPLLAMGEVVQLGRSTSRGHGRIEVEWLG